MKDLGTLGGSGSTALAINNAGKVAGAAALPLGDPSGDTHAFVYDIASATMTDLETLGGSTSQARGINDVGQITGVAFLQGNHARAAIFHPDLTVEDLGTLGGDRSEGYDINDAGHVVGSSYTADHVEHAFLYDGATMKDLGTLGLASLAYDINDAGQVVGASYNAEGLRRAFLYDNGTMYNLMDLVDGLSDDIVLNDARGINERGDIAANGCYVAGPFLGQCHAFLLTALDTDIVSSVPEPGSLALLGGALLGVPLLRRLRAVRH